MSRASRTVPQSQELATSILRDYIDARIAGATDRRIKRAEIRDLLRYRGLGAYIDLAIADLVREGRIEQGPEGDSVYALGAAAQPIEPVRGD
jgi:hypothetical protein